MASRVRKVVSRMILVVVALVAGVVGLLLVWSFPGRPAPFVDEDGVEVPGSLSEKVWVDINGASQGMILRGRDATRPVLLFLHGGMPEYFLAEQVPRGLEELFVVCWWDQRGAGLSFQPGARARVTTEQLIADTLEVTRYLQRRFKQDRIYLMGHSGGTFLGMQVIARAPERFHAYVGVAQMVNQLRSEQQAWTYAHEEFRRLGDAAMVDRLERNRVTADGIPSGYLALRDEAMHRLGVGTTRQMRSVVSGLFLPSLRSRSFTLGEKLNLWRGKRESGVSAMWDDMTHTDLSERVPKVEVPVFFFHGAYDFTCSRSEAERYLERLDAPSRRFYLFEHSAHSPVLEEPERALAILRDDVLGARAAPAP